MCLSHCEKVRHMAAELMRLMVVRAPDSSAQHQRVHLSSPFDAGEEG